MKKDTSYCPEQQHFKSTNTQQLEYHILFKQVSWNIIGNVPVLETRRRLHIHWDFFSPSHGSKGKSPSTQRSHPQPAMPANVPDRYPNEIHTRRRTTTAYHTYTPLSFEHQLSCSYHKHNKHHSVANNIYFFSQHETLHEIYPLSFRRVRCLGTCHVTTAHIFNFFFSICMCYRLWQAAATISMTTMMTTLRRDKRKTVCKNVKIRTPSSVRNCNSNVRKM